MLLRLQQAGYGYPSGFELKSIDWEVGEGSFSAIIGPNGCGKSTLVRVISRFLPLQRGRIRLLDRPLESYSARQLARKLAVIPSENHFEFPFPAEEVVSMGRYPHLGRLQALLPSDREAVAEAMRLTDTEGFAGRAISQLSSGERQRVLLARALAQQPSLLVLDEPNTHLDIHHQIAVFRLLRRLVDQRRMSVIVVLHDLSMAGVFCDRVALLSAGRLIQEGPPSEVITTETIRRVYGADVHILRTESGTPLISYSARPNREPRA